MEELKNAVLNAMKALAEQRRLYHSEGDFKFSLGCKLTEELQLEIVPRIEFPSINEEARIHTDIFFEYNQKKIGIELKYKTTNFDFNDQGEQFNFPGAVGGDRFEFLADIKRLEDLVENHSIDYGFAILLTNCKWWNDKYVEVNDQNQRVRYFPIQLTQNREIHGEISFEYNRKHDFFIRFILEGTYLCNWRDYSVLENGEEFKYLLISIS